MLLKCALNGQDANWGRILCAIGYSDPQEFTVDPSTVSVSFLDSAGQGEELLLLKNGEPQLPVDETRALELLKREEIDIRVRIGQGEAKATYYTCDLSHVSSVLAFGGLSGADFALQEYVSVNADCWCPPLLLYPIMG